LRFTNSKNGDPAPPSADGLAEQAGRYLDRAGSPFFLFVNLIDPHLPRSPAPEHEAAFVEDNLADAPIVTNERTHTVGDADLGPRAMRRLRQLYDADLRTMDDRLDAVLDALSAAGVRDDALVAVFSDHGEHLGEFGLVGHQHSVFDSVVSVPLAVDFPDGGPDRVDEQVELRRLYHTILDETGLDSFPERSLASGLGDDTARGAFYTPMLDLEALLWEGTARYEPDLLGESLSFVRDGDTKLVRFDGAEWLFDLPEREPTSLSLDRVPDEYAWLADPIDAPAT
jgi:hypothetical protein